MKTLYIVMEDHGPDYSPSVRYIATTREKALEVLSDLPGEGHYIEDYLASDIDAD